MYRIGVDVGGTNTDAALLDVTAFNTPGRGVLASCKSPTTADVTSGITTAIETVLIKSGAPKTSVLSVTIGTTHFINALIEADARRLSRVAVVRLCGPFTRQIPPFTDFPVGLRRVMEGGAWFLDGGLEIDGREIAPLDPMQIKDCVEQIQSKSLRTVAIVGVFSPLDHEGIHEEECRRQMLAIDPSLRIVCSRDIGPPGYLERENATILNAAILDTAQKTIRSFKMAMRRLQLQCPLYLSQNDGTLIDAEAAAELPIKTFGSGPTNSMTGAAFLAGLGKPRALHVDGETTSEGPDHQVLVVDIGGTTTDVCALLPSGFPRQAPNFVELGGVRTAFSMPEVVSIGLGGGSKVQVSSETDVVSVGPDSVGHFLTEQALVFGGPTLTSSDIVVASGMAQLGDASKVAHIPASTIEAAQKQMRQMLESVIEKMKMSAAPVHILLVGGGSLLVTEKLSNVAKCEKPVHHDAANAVGAAIAKVAGEVDIIEIMQGKDEKAVIKAACQQAIHAAVQKGADPSDVKVVTIDKIPLQYTANKAMRLVIKAVGALATPEAATVASLPAEFSHVRREETQEEGIKVRVPDAAEPTTKPASEVNLDEYRPQVRDGVWYISEVDLELIATGTGILGTGGGGPSYLELLHGLNILRNKGGAGKMRVVPPTSLKDSDLVGFGSWYGAPSVINERIGSGSEIITGIETVKKILGIGKVDAILADEIGGGNGMSPFATGVHYDIPVIDGDAMGRAYPTMYHATLYVYGNPITPCSLSDAKGNSAVIMQAESPLRVEGLLRTTAVELGLGCAVCARPLSADIIKSLAVPNTMSQAWYLGQAVHRARRSKISYVDAILATTTGKLLFTGKIIDVRREIGKGYTMGSVLLAEENPDAIPSTTSGESTRRMIIPFQNEFLYAAYADEAGNETNEILCTVPDLISILGQDGEAIGSQDLRYGLHVSVIAMPAHPLWKTEQGLVVGGPAGFGLTIPFIGVGEYAPPRSVIEDYGKC
ncbi:putative hydantoinase/oxoprolinase [Cryphonectria parasitica EP155]|uniref:Hydantoinase/oxoprolinase n=1 Tax=Cryphonectria parasitica (strain ATCC 38755 / EP155) TaxID=660469 RepID=A0A9P5CNM4_CRYP1|nr:putative hydantoinase/oxoprolinase [Cryphonectria parasitica EP155]KAF3764075.1 putative hydantoinase/oxoprolinase [Cryphonectria parasitica EP155]